jgi:hypothetical protein
MERYLLQRADGAFFRHPTNDDEREWTDSPMEAHRWVDLDAAKAAAYVWHHLKAEDVMVTPLELFPNGYELSVGRR